MIKQLLHELFVIGPINKLAVYPCFVGFLCCNLGICNAIYSAAFLLLKIDFKILKCKSKSKECFDVISFSLKQEC